jgi:hypothetical protein
LFVGKLAQVTDLVESIAMNSLLNIFLGLFRSGVHLIDSFAIRLSPRQKELLDHLWAHLRSQYLIDLFVVEESNFPIFVTEILRKVFKISSLVPFDILERDQLALLLVRELIYKNFAEYL